MSTTREKDRVRAMNYYRSKHGLATRIYHNQKLSSKHRIMPMPTYTLEELREWLFSQEKYHVLFDNWKRLDFQKAYVPSVDRIDDYVGYTMANIQLTIWKDNEARIRHDEKNGINTKRCKAVLQFTKDNDFIKRYHSVSQAERETEVGKSRISAVCKGKRKTAGGFIWMFENKTKGQINGK